MIYVDSDDNYGDLTTGGAWAGLIVAIAFAVVASLLLAWLTGKGFE